MSAANDRRVAVVTRLRRRYWDRLEATKSTKPVDRVAVALDHLRAALRYADPDTHATTIASAVAALAGPAEEILTRYERSGAPK